MGETLARCAPRFHQPKLTWFVLAAVVVVVVSAGPLVGPRTGIAARTVSALQVALAAHAHDPYTLTSPNLQDYGTFGYSAAISGSTLVVGAPGETVGGNAYAGNVYVFKATTGSLVKTLTSPNPPSGEFGFSVAMSGKTVVVGAPEETYSGELSAGRAYVFNTAGTLLTTLVSPDPQIGADFGWQVAISGSTIAVSAPFQEVLGQPIAGQVYLFKTTGSLMQTLTSPDTLYYGNGNSSYFGYGLALSGSTVIVGAPGESAPGCPYGGHAYVYKTTSGTLLETLTSPNANPYGDFGYTLAVSGKTVIIGAPGEAVAGQNDSGRAYAFALKTGALTATFVSPNGAYEGFFGNAVAMSKSTVVIGAFGETISNATEAGRAYSFSSSGSLLSTFTSPNVQSYGQFGLSVAVSGKTTIIGAPYEMAAGLVNAGHAYRV